MGQNGIQTSIGLGGCVSKTDSDLSECRVNVVGDGYSALSGVGDRNRVCSDGVREVCLSGAFVSRTEIQRHSLR